MKQFLLSLSLAMTSFVFGQNLEFHENGVSISEAVIIIDSAATSDHSIGNYYLVNNTAGPISVSWSRTRLAQTNVFTDQICDDVLCFDATNTTVYNRPTTMTVAAGDSTVFQPKVYPHGTAGCAIYTYKAYSGLGAYEDSIQVKYRFGGQDCFLSTPETPITYSVYPNPASSYLNIQVSTGGNSVQIKVYNIMGELVERVILVDGQNTISVTDLTNGIYFYSIIKNNEVVETKKLIVRH